MFLDSALACRVENAEALNAAACGESVAVAGGYAAFAGRGSPLTHALGIGMNGPVPETEFDALEEFYQSRGSPAILEFCPHAHSSLLTLLGDRRYRIVECSNVLVGPVIGTEDARVRMAKPEEKDAWATLMLEGFFSRTDLTGAEMELGTKMFTMPDGQAWFGIASGASAAAGASNVRNGLAMLFADSTLERARGQGLQLALIRARLAYAAKLGCDLAMASALPGSTSQRNYERAGFRVAYTRLGMRRDFTE